MLNRMTLQGRLVRDPELSTTGNGTSVCKFSVAWSETYGDKETVLFLNCTAWQKTGELIAKYFTKGQECVIEGRLETQKYEKDGENRAVINCTVDRIHFSGKKADEAAAPGKARAADLKPIDESIEPLPF